MEETTKKTLELLLEKAYKLRFLRFTKFIESSSLSVGYSWQASDQQLRFNWNFPDEEEIEAFILTFRFFVQERESISFRTLNKNHASDPELSDNWKEAFTSARKFFNEYLDAFPRLRVMINGSVPTRRDILFTFLYGELAHAEPKYRQQYEVWKQSPIALLCLKWEFLNTLCHSLDVIFHVAYFTEQELGLPTRLASQDAS